MLLKFLIPLCLLTIGAWAAPRSALLGAKECTWGPSYWCQNLTSAHGCKAVKHCISNVWEHKTVPNDPDDICSICKKMVGEARDQLASNMTMDELKQVFEGSCKLIYIKPAVKICDQLADELVPELVDTITSQMNPDVVCSVAGLCNNAEIDAAIAEGGKVVEKVEDKKAVVKVEDKKAVKAADLAKQNCNVCSKFANKTSKLIQESKQEDILAYLLDLCGKTGSYADSCASIVLMQQGTLLPALQVPLPADQLCVLTGSCVSSRPVLPGEETCDLCQQLVLHFKDIVTADTTEVEFKKVLLGVCKQTKKFAQECGALVEEYSDQVFKIISQDLDGKKICSFLNICPAPGIYINGPVEPMLPIAPVPIPQGRDMTTEKPRPTIAYGDSLSVSVFRPAELMVARPPPSLLNDTQVNGQQECIFCQYVLHYVQKMISQPYGIDAIKKAMDKVCEEMPKSITLQCQDFVQMYGDAFAAILAQEIDPSQVCPSLKVCPAQLSKDRYEPDVMVGVPGCPLCLMAVQALDEQLANNKTEESVKDALDKLCSRLPKALSAECTELVSAYTEQLVDMILADFTPEEVCEYLKICKKPPSVELLSVHGNEDFGVLTNEVLSPQQFHSQESLESEENSHENLKTGSSFVRKQKKESEENSKENLKAGPGCVLCEFVLEKIDDMIKQNSTQVDIDLVLNGICNHLPRTVRPKCQKFVVKYAEQIINTLAVMVPPSEVCSYMGLCLKETLRQMEAAVADCAMCDQLTLIHERMMKRSNPDLDRAHFLMNACDGVDYNEADQCRDFMQQHGVKLFISLNTRAGSDEHACQHVGVCSRAQQARVQIQTAAKRTPQPLGADKCTHGPGYWCSSRANALKCGVAAVKHCQDNVWPF